MKAVFNRIILAALLALLLDSASAATKGIIVASEPGNAIEINLELEDWMVDRAIWGSFERNMDSDHPLVIEDWMIFNDLWMYDGHLSREETDKKLEVEQWMLNEFTTEGHMIQM